MKLKDIKGFPEKKKNHTADKEEFTLNWKYNQALSEIGEMEVAVDKELLTLLLAGWSDCINWDELANEITGLNLLTIKKGE